MTIPTDFGRCWDPETEFGTYDNGDFNFKGCNIT